MVLHHPFNAYGSTTSSPKVRWKKIISPQSPNAFLQLRNLENIIGN